MSRIQKFDDIPIHFVTTNIKDGIWLFNKEKYCQIIVDNLKFYRDKYKFKILAWVIIPWHLHFLFWLPEDVKISSVMRDFKSYSAKQVVWELKREGRLEVLEKFRISESPSRSWGTTPRGWGTTRPGTTQLSEVKVPALGWEAGALAPADRDKIIVRGRPPAGAGSNPAGSNPAGSNPAGSNPAGSNPAGSNPAGVLLPSGSEPEPLLRLPLAERNKRRTVSEFQIFQDDFYDFNVYSKKKYDEKIKYIEETNPIKHNLVSLEELENYRWSSFRSRWFEDDSLIKVDYLEWWGA